MYDPESVTEEYLGQLRLSTFVQNYEQYAQDARVETRRLSNICWRYVKRRWRSGR
ncbi:hypothetical protein KDK_57450 [Dictyobacter kobayashii]|uniref:Uncharacterized protein n=1 Tax=Dictyobacter kobayashii TaxID=2014872 RepID=A0A402AS65_9CHLR|nr:hypothetical protein KDK_57450 [Dictyobacter kobayashii]